jgi:hypothetical protein
VCLLFGLSIMLFGEVKLMEGIDTISFLFELCLVVNLSTVYHVSFILPKGP